MEAPSRADLDGIGFDHGVSFGIEVEFYCDAARSAVASYIEQNADVTCRSERYNHETRNHWKLVTDGSLTSSSSEEDEYDCSDCELNSRFCDNDCAEHCQSYREPSYGMELVSPPLKGEAGVEEAWRVLKALNRLNVWTDETCGTHVHLGADHLQLDDFKTLAKLYVTYERTLDCVIPEERREGGNTHVRQLFRPENGGSLRALFERIDRANNLDDITNNWYDRYYTLNLFAFDQHGTAEFRQPEGDVDFHKTLHWVALVQHFFAAAQRREYVDWRLAESEAPSFANLAYTLRLPLALRSYFQSIYDQNIAEVTRKREVMVRLAREHAEYMAREARERARRRREAATFALTDAPAAQFAPVAREHCYGNTFALPDSVREMIYNELNAAQIEANLRSAAERVARDAYDRNQRAIERREWMLCASANGPAQPIHGNLHTFHLPDPVREMIARSA